MHQNVKIQYIIYEKWKYPNISIIYQQETCAKKLNMQLK